MGRRKELILNDSQRRRYWARPRAESATQYIGGCSFALLFTLIHPCTHYSLPSEIYHSGTNNICYHRAGLSDSRQNFYSIRNATSLHPKARQTNVNLINHPPRRRHAKQGPTPLSTSKPFSPFNPLANPLLRSPQPSSPPPSQSTTTPECTRTTPPWRTAFPPKRTSASPSPPKRSRPNRNLHAIGWFTLC